MSQSPDTLTPTSTLSDDPAYRDMLTWAFPATPFYAAQVRRVLQDDVPQRIAYGRCTVWVYRNCAGYVVGFSSIEISREYAKYTNGLDHMYIPVLGVHPDFQGRGYGKKIVDHLIAEAALYHRIPCDISDKFFLDVYTANRAAIRLYESKGFIVLNPDTPIVDASENNETYVIMARSVASVGI